MPAFACKLARQKGYSYEENALAQAGYLPDRTYYEMRITMAAAAPSRRIFRPTSSLQAISQHEADLPQFVEVFRNSFSDHYGYVEEPFEQ